MAKIGLMVEGGGMKCAYSAGVLDAFLDAGITFPYGIGVSAGAANLASFQAGQRDRNRRFYVVHVKDPRYISLRNFLKTGNYFGLQFIYGDMTNEGGMDPLDYDKLIANPAEMYFPATDGASGKPRYFSKEDCGRKDYRPIMATCALPVVSQPIHLDGHDYFDGGVSDSVPIQKMLDDGCDKVVCLMSKPHDFAMQPQRHRLAYTVALRHKYPKIVECLNNRHKVYNQQMKQLHKLEKEGRAMLFCPPGDVQMSTYTTDPEVMQQLYDEGLLAGRARMDELTAFINGE